MTQSVAQYAILESVALLSVTETASAIKFHQTQHQSIPLIYHNLDIYPLYGGYLSPHSKWEQGAI